MTRKTLPALALTAALASGGCDDLLPGHQWDTWHYIGSLSRCDARVPELEMNAVLFLPSKMRQAAQLAGKNCQPGYQTPNQLLEAIQAAHFRQEANKRKAEQDAEAARLHALRRAAALSR